MSLGPHDEERAAQGLRLLQEREIALGHSMTTAEHALAQEAYALGRTFERTGLDFDPLTFVVLRIIEGSEVEQIDPVACVEVLERAGFIDRSVALAHVLLGEVA